MVIGRVGTGPVGAGAGGDAVAGTDGGAGSVRGLGEFPTGRGGATAALGSGLAGTATGLTGAATGGAGDATGVTIAASIGSVATGSVGTVPAFSAGAEVSTGATGFGGGLRTALISPLTMLPTSTATPAPELDPEPEEGGRSVGGVPAGVPDWAKAAVVANAAIATPSIGRISASPSRSPAFLPPLSSGPRARRGAFSGGRGALWASL